MKKLLSGLLSVSFFIVAPPINFVQAHGTVDGGHCYNGWHLKNGKCHEPHSTSEGSRYIKNGGRCYNGWFLDKETGKCVKSRGVWGWLTD
jgi:hypothetical protein